MPSEFPVQMEAYLATLSPGYPRTLEEMIERAKEILAPLPDGGVPNPTRWNFLHEELNGGSLDDYEYNAMRDHGLPLVRAILVDAMYADNLDAIVYPTSSTPPGPAGVYRGQPGALRHQPGQPERSPRHRRKPFHTFTTTELKMYLRQVHNRL